MFNCRKKYLDRTALYYLTLTSPWTLQTHESKRKTSELIPEAGHTYSNFVQYMKKLKGYDTTSNSYKSSFLNRCLYSYIVETSRNMKTKVTNKLMSAKYRARSADMWEVNQKGPSKYPKNQSVCQSINYWRHKHNIDNTSNLKATNNANEELEINDTETLQLIKTLQDHCSNTTDLATKKNVDLNNYLNSSHKAFLSIAMKYEKNEREYLNNFSSNESAEKVWNSIREKEFQEAIIQMKTMKLH